MPPPGSFLADLAEGWHELAIRPWYWINLIAHACWNFAMPAMLVLGPVIAARSLGGATAWGLISASFGVGAVAAGLFVLRVKPRRPLVVGNLLLTLGALPLLALAFSRSVPLICAANVLDGFGLVSLNGLWTPTMQVLIPEKVRSRVDSYDWLVSLVIMPVGFAVAGPLGVRHRLHLDPGRGRDRALGPVRAGGPRARHPRRAPERGRRDRRPRYGPSSLPVGRRGRAGG